MPTLPTQVVIFGASGDLAARKLVPALASAFRQGHFPGPVQVVGVARRPWDDGQFRAHLTDKVGDPAKDPGWAGFLPLLRYVRTELDTAADYQALAAALDGLAAGPTHRVFYLAVKPDLFLPTIHHLHAVGLLAQTADGPRRRVVVEKPFGHDLASAVSLNAELLGLLGEDQIYRIDHYLGKETVQNLLVFRFRNALFEPLWNTKHIELVQITVAEAVAMENGRGGYYDTAGAARDILQNHVLQVLALIAMEPPSTLSAKDIRDEKVKVLKALRGFDHLEDPATAIVRGQYEGYRSEPGVAPGSVTETYLAARTHIDNWRWGGVPFLLRTGKALPARFTSVTVQFRMPPHTLFGSYDECHLRPNRLTLRIQPNEGIDIDFDAKEPGQGLVIRPAKFEFDYARAFQRPPPEAYERLLLDVISGDQSLFIRSDEIEQSWRWTDALRGAMRYTPRYTYPRASWGPPAADSLFGECEGRWLNAPR
jgi:glucose-6-phosphate 1-dehydrogenase